MIRRGVYVGFIFALGTSACAVNMHAGTGPATATAPGRAPAPAPAPLPGTAPRYPAPAPVVAQPQPAPAQPVPAPAPAPDWRSARQTRMVRVPATAAAGGAREIEVPMIRGPISFGDGDARGALRGLVYFIPDTTQRFPDVGQLKPEAVLYTNSLNVSLRDFKEGFPGVSDRVEWFAIRYEGKFNVSHGGDYTFRLTSDDGSLLTIDDRLIIDNDGRHVPKEMFGKVSLAQGEHTIRLDYFQALRWAVQLQLSVQPPGGEPERMWSPNL